MRPHFSPTYRVPFLVPSGTSRVRNRRLFFRICFVASCEMAVAGRTGPNTVGIMPKVHDVWVNSLAALLGALAAIYTLSEILMLPLPGTSAVFTAIPSSPRMRVPHEAYAFRIRQQFALPALLCAWHHAPADELVQQMAHH